MLWSATAARYVRRVHGAAALLSRLCAGIRGHRRVQYFHSFLDGRVELKFYLLFPPVAFLMIKNANWRFAVIAIAAALFTAQGSFIAEAYCACCSAP